MEDHATALRVFDGLVGRGLTAQLKGHNHPGAGLLEYSVEAMPDRPWELGDLRGLIEIAEKERVQLHIDGQSWAIFS